MKNTLYTFLFSLILGFTAQAQVLNVPTVEQEQDLCAGLVFLSRLWTIMEL